MRFFLTLVFVWSLSLSALAGNKIKLEIIRMETSVNSISKQSTIDQNLQTASVEYPLVKFTFTANELDLVENFLTYTTDPGFEPIFHWGNLHITPFDKDKVTNYSVYIEARITNGTDSITIPYIISYGMLSLTNGGRLSGSTGFSPSIAFNVQDRYRFDITPIARKTFLGPIAGNTPVFASTILVSPISSVVTKGDRNRTTRSRPPQ